MSFAHRKHETSSQAVTIDQRLDTFLSRLENVKYRNGGYKCRCPAHDDKSKDSLSVGIGQDGQRLILKCWAGCASLDVISAIGLDWSDLYPKEDHYRSLVYQHQIKPRKTVDDYVVDIAIHSGAPLSDADRKRAKLAQLNGGKSFGWCEEVKREASKPLPTDTMQTLESIEDYNAAMTELNHYLNTEQQQ